MIFQIKSLKQLIVLSFTLVFIPLVVLLWQSNSMLTKMAESAAREPIYALSLARNVNVLEGLMVDIERVTRQYQVVKNEESVALVESYLVRYREAAEQLCRQISSNQLCRDNLHGLAQLEAVYTLNETLLNDALASLNQALIKLKDSAVEQLDQRLAKQQSEIALVKTKQVWFTVALITTSLLFALFSSHKILAPVRKLGKLIKELAGNQHQLSPVSSTGPIELIELEQELHILAKRLNRLENLRKAMLRHAAHELKTPLASIKEGCLLLSDQVLGHLNPEQLEVMSLLNSSAQRLELLVEQLLDYNMLLQQSQAQLTFFPHEQLMTSFMTDNQLALQQHQYQMDLDLQVTELYADPVLFRRVLDNLLSNAIAHGVPKTTIYVRLFHRQGNQILEFANQGEAISSENRGLYFKPFQRGARPRLDRVSGSGLGLSIVAECASLMQGSASFIDVDYADVCVQVAISLPKERV